MGTLGVAVDNIGANMLRPARPVVRSKGRTPGYGGIIFPVTEHLQMKNWLDVAIRVYRLV